MAATTMSSGLRRHIMLSMPSTVPGCCRVPRFAFAQMKVQCALQYSRQQEDEGELMGSLLQGLLDFEPHGARMQALKIKHLAESITWGRCGC